MPVTCSLAVLMSVLHHSSMDASTCKTAITSPCTPDVSIVERVAGSLLLTNEEQKEGFNQNSQSSLLGVAAADCSWNGMEGVPT